MTVKELKKQLESFPDEMPITLFDEDSVEFDIKGLIGSKVEEFDPADKLITIEKVVISIEEL